MYTFGTPQSLSATIDKGKRMNFVIIVGSVRSDRQGIKAARFIERSFMERGHEVTLIDPIEQQLPLLDRMYKEYPKGSAPEALERLAAIYRAADGFLIVSGEYNHSIPPALSNLLDHFLEEYFFRPSAIVCYSAGQSLTHFTSASGYVHDPARSPRGNRIVFDAHCARAACGRSWRSRRRSKL